jgi:hypothetical protein
LAETNRVFASLSTYRFPESSLKKFGFLLKFKFSDFWSFSLILNWIKKNCKRGLKTLKFWREDKNPIVKFKFNIFFDWLKFSIDYYLMWALTDGNLYVFCLMQNLGLWYLQYTNPSLIDQDKKCIFFNNTLINGTIYFTKYDVTIR